MSNARGVEDKTVEFTYQSRLNADILLDIITIPELALLIGVYKMLEEHREERNQIYCLGTGGGARKQST